MKKSIFALIGLVVMGLSACNSGSTAENTETYVTDIPKPEEVVMEQFEEVEEETDEKTGESQFLAYSETEYKAALAEGKDVFLDFHADWCPLCLANKPIIEAAFDEFGDDKVIGFQVNFDTETALRKEFNIFSQSQLVWIKDGNKEEAETYAPGLFTTEKITDILNS